MYSDAWQTPLTATDPTGTEPYPWHNKNPTRAERANWKNYNAYGFSDKQTRARPASSPAFGQSNAMKPT